ncbi:Putative transcriptional regulator%2C TetR family [Mycobacteroides abscessus]|uniref:TetR family transcriptional regulator n=4 Tax=Mycobacteroides abscessus TaxID=36809 RepID=A0A829HRR3_9MYCO|nr:TetR/AcrR family transcriptional regulator [Mycobacteroides abscessus]ESV56402.1 bacterial regulatory s, tetR family protein [Mycobacteroides abscessus MAB_082312_2258]ESV64808.1 bacterial regulatory s, tetR family protein [Mycobacteroides abscessus MAB_091912_2446]AGM30192.1 TetR family transcriptional regulator [Mycobacteroides abscessus subsp. bolletii 50594]AIC71574.1 TetR family transcriptional regulator [Mycobacteroides abscessus subsp. massiliense str. GO 06]AMU27331.1 TetR family tr
MPRVVKHPELRRTELLDLAMTLFLERGYERVSLNDLIATSGMSKGAFYHYFSSKEALVSALAARSADQAFEALRPVFEEQGKGALERLNSGLRAGYEVKMALGAPESIGAMASMMRPENQSLLRRISAIWEDRFRPVLTEVIAQGVAEGVFDTFDPEGVGDMIQALAATMGTAVQRIIAAPDARARAQAIDAAVLRQRLYGIATDRILGLPDGTIEVLDRDQIEALVAVL